MEEFKMYAGNSTLLLAAGRAQSVGGPISIWSRNQPSHPFTGERFTFCIEKLRIFLLRLVLICFLSASHCLRLFAYATDLKY